MARIPQRSLVAPRFSGVDVPQGAFGAPAQAMAGLMQTIGGSVDVVLQHAQKAQEIRNKADVREQMRQMRQSQADFMQEIEANKIDPANWNKEWQGRLDRYEAELKSRKFPPVVVQELTNRFKDFAGESMISISGAALRENLRRARAGVELDHQEFMRTEQFDKAEENILQAMDDGTFDEVTGNAMIQGIGHKREETDMDVHMRLDPVDFIENIDSYDLPPKRKLDTLDKAERELSAAGRRGVEAINEGIELGLIQTKEELKAELEHYNAIPKGVKKSILENFANREPLTNSEKFVVGDKIHDDFEAFKKGVIDLEEYGKRHDQNQSAIDALGTRGGAGELKSLNYQRSPVHFMRDEDGEDAPEAARRRASEMSDTVSRAKQLARVRASGATKKSTAQAVAENRALGQTGTVDRATLDAAQAETEFVFRARLEDEMVQWLQSLDTGYVPTESEMRAYLDKIQPRVLNELRQERRAAAAGDPIRRSTNIAPGQPRTHRQDVQEFFDNDELQSFEEFRQRMDPVNPLLPTRPR